MNDGARRPIFCLRPMTLTVMMVGLLIGSSCAAQDVDQDFAVVEALGGLPYETASDITTYGDVALVFSVVSERAFENADIQPRADGSAGTIPPPELALEDGYVGRVVRVEVESVVWDSGRADIPKTFEFVDLGYQVTKGERRPVVGASGVRLEISNKYVGVFSLNGDRLAPMNPNALYELHNGRLVRPADGNGSHVPGPPELGELSISKIAKLLAGTPVHPYALPYMTEQAGTRAAMIARALADSESTAVSSSVPRTVDSLP